MDIIYKEGICVCKDIAVSILFVHLPIHPSMDICTHLFIPLKYKCHKTTSFNIALTMKDPLEDPTLEQVDFMQQSLSHKLDDTPSKKLCKYINFHHKR